MGGVWGRRFWLGHKGGTVPPVDPGGTDAHGSHCSFEDAPGLHALEDFRRRRGHTRVSAHGLARSFLCLPPECRLDGEGRGGCEPLLLVVPGYGSGEHASVMGHRFTQSRNMVVAELKSPLTLRSRLAASTTLGPTGPRRPRCSNATGCSPSLHGSNRAALVSTDPTVLRLLPHPHAGGADQSPPSTELQTAPQQEQAQQSPIPTCRMRGTRET